MDPSNNAKLQPPTRLPFLKRNSVHPAYSPTDIAIRSMTPPREGLLRTRRVISRSNAHSTGKYPSWKMRRHLYWDSVHELNAFRLLDSFPEVQHFVEQPFKIAYSIGGIVQHHYPDILVEVNSNKELWEIKTDKHSNLPDIRSRTAVLTKLLAQQGFIYRLVTAEEIQQEPFLTNANKLLRYGRPPISVQSRKWVRVVFSEVSTISYSELYCHLKTVDARSIIFRLILEGILKFDRAKILTKETQLWLPQSIRG